MITIDQHSKDQNNNNWHSSHNVLDAADSQILAVDPAALSYAQDDTRPKSARPVDPVTPAGAGDPIPAPSNQNPSPDTPGDLLSAPNDDNDSTSSLSPAPSPNTSRDPPTVDAHPGAAAVDDPTHTSLTLGPVSRQSTPLTELSAPMTPSRAKDDDAAHPEGLETEPQAGKKKDAQDGDGRPGVVEKTGVVAEGVQSANDPSLSREGSEQGKAKLFEKGTMPSGSGSAQPPPVTGMQASSSPSSSAQPNGIPPAMSAEIRPSGNGTSGIHKTPPDPPDEKATAILQLNAELLKVCMECQTRHMMQSTEFSAYANRLQSNLTWLAAAADKERHKHIPLPMMSPPPAVPWYSTQAINEFYQRLPNLFAKEISRRQKEAAQANASGLKRGPDTAADDTNGMRKRVDTGERRSSNPVSSTSPPHARSPSVMSNGTVGSVSGLNLGMNLSVEPHGTPAQPMSLGMSGPRPQPQLQPQPPIRVSPETMPPPTQQQLFAASGGMPVDPQMVQARERARIMQMRQNQHQHQQQQQQQHQVMAAKEPQRMAPPSLPNGLQGSVPPASNSGPPPPPPPAAAGVGQNNNQHVMQAVLNTFGQSGLQNYHALQQGMNNPFIAYMCNNVPGFLQLPLQHQLQRMQLVQANIQQNRAQQAQRAAAAATPVGIGMNGMNQQGVADPVAPFSRHSGSPPNVSPTHMQQPQQQQGQGMQHMSPTTPSSALPYAGANGMGLPIQSQRATGGTVPQNMGGAGLGGVGLSGAGMGGAGMGGTGMGGAGMGGAGMGGTGMGGLPAGMNPNNMTAQQRQLFLMQQQMHQRGNDGVISQQQAYAAAQEKLRQEQQSRMSNHPHQQQQQQQQPQHSSSHNAGGSPPNPGSLATQMGIGTPGMPGIARSARSPTDVAPMTPRMPQKRPGQNDIYQMALYNQQAMRHVGMGGAARPGTSMGGMVQQQQQQQQSHQQQHQQQPQPSVSPYGANGGTINPGMMYGGAGGGMNAHATSPQNWGNPLSQPHQQQQLHSVSPAALQHHPDSGTPRPTSSASNNAMMPTDAMGESFDALFNWNGT